RGSIEAIAGTDTDLHVVKLSGRTEFGYRRGGFHERAEAIDDDRGLGASTDVKRAIVAEFGIAGAPLTQAINHQIAVQQDAETGMEAAGDIVANIRAPTKAGDEIVAERDIAAETDAAGGLTVASLEELARGT